MLAKIYKPSKSAMQSGPGKAKGWVLEYEPAEKRRIEPLMGWTTSGDMTSQIHLDFASKEEAIAYAEKHGIPFRVEEPKPVVRRPVMSYSDNFKYNRTVPWTH
jgi:hypothetical protein